MSLKSCKQQVSHSQTACFRYFRDSYRIITAEQWMPMNADEYRAMLRMVTVEGIRLQPISIFQWRGYRFGILLQNFWRSSSQVLNDLHAAQIIERLDSRLECTSWRVLILKLTKISNVALDSECDRYGRVIIIELNQWNSDWDKRQSRIRILLDSLLQWLQ